MAIGGFSLLLRRSGYICAFLGAHIALFGLIWFIFFQPVVDFFSNWDLELNQKAELIATSRKILGQSDTTPSLNPASMNLFVPPLTDTLRVELQGSIRQMADESGVQLRSIEEASYINDGPLKQIGFITEGQGNMRSIQNFLIKIEAHEPWILINRSLIRKLPNVGAAEQDNHFIQLDVRFLSLLVEK